jgi:hypothetical protein
VEGDLEAFGDRRDDDRRCLNVHLEHSGASSACPKERGENQNRWQRIYQ